MLPNYQYNMAHPVYFVSLGPGDPELITVKGLRTLQQSDIIYCPGTLNPEGQLHSRSHEIIKALDIETSVSIFPLPMSKDRTLALKTYNDLCYKIIQDKQSGMRIAIVAEGDAGFYSSIQYLYEQLSSKSIPVERIAGVPAFIAAGSLAGLHIVKQEEHLHIIPGKTTEEELSSLTKEGFVIVIMKLPQCKAEINCFINQNPYLNYHYFEYIGDERQFYTNDIREISNRTFPYFSLLLIRPVGA